MGRYTSYMFAFAALVVLVLAGYAGALVSDFAYDDYRLVVRNESLDAPGALLDSFRGDYYRSTLDTGRLGYYRPLSVVLNVIDRQVWGLEARGYHLSNILLHILAVALLWLLLRRFIAEPWALLAAALFAVHPTRAESVTFISGRVDVLAGIFYLAVLLFLSRRRPLGPRPLDLVGAALAAAAAILSKEMAVTLVVVAPLLVYRLPMLTGAGGGGPGEVPTRGVPPAPAHRREALWTLVMLAAVVLVVAALRALVLGELTRHTPASIVSWPPRVLITLGEYLRALAFPAWSIRLEPPLVVDHWTAAALAPALLCALTIAAIVWTWNRVPRVATGLLATLLALLPVAQLVPLETAWAERFLYIPAALAALAVGGAAAWLARAWRPARSRRVVAIVLALLLVVELAFLWHRNQAWRDDESLWRAVMASGQISAKAYNNRGVNLMERGDMNGAAVAYRRALAIDGDLPTAHFNLGVVHWSQGRLDSALVEMRRAIELRPHDLDFALKLGAAAREAGRFEVAGDAYRRVLELEPGSIEARFGLALVHYAGGDLEGCRRWCDQVLAVVPDHGGALFQRGRVREQQGEPEAALADYAAAAAADPRSIAARVRAGRVLAMLDRPCEAQRVLEEATALAAAAGAREAEGLREAAAAMAGECGGR